jgi:MYXO-CTERM domain-containing protein
MRRLIIATSILSAIAAAPRAADAFCGFYVEGSGAKLFNDATQVVLMREGTRTVLSMQNHYAGPAEAFAMVVPVPTVLKEEEVKTLPRDVLDRLEAMDAPRLVEYWEKDPCAKEPPHKVRRRSGEKKDASRPEPKAEAPDDLGVTIEAQFEVGEYQIVILSATDSTGLETWLAREKYAVPDGAAPFLRPYVEGGWKFFVAKVDPAKVKVEDGKTILSPLRFHYDSDDFVLPVRLGLINSSGTQDLIVHVLARGTRYEVENRPNVFIPTNLDVKDEVRSRFGEFYAALFDRTVEKNPGAVVTEYAWDASTCDPCPGPTVSAQDLATLGADVIGATGGRFVLTRLHARYGTELSEDLVFKQASAVTGGREVRGGSGTLDIDARPGNQNMFQARYAIRHEWTGPIACADPVRGRWGGPPAGEANPGTQAGRDLAFAPRGKVELAQLVVDSLPELDVKAAGATPASEPATTTPPPAADPPVDTGPVPSEKKGCGCHAGAGATPWAALAVLAALARRRRRR